MSKTELTKNKEDKSDLRGKKINEFTGNCWQVRQANSCNMLDMVLVKLVKINQKAVFCCPFQGGFASQLVSSCDRKMPTLNATVLNNPRGCSSFIRGILTQLACRTRHLSLLCRPLLIQHVNSVSSAFTVNSCLLVCENHFRQSGSCDQLFMFILGF